jgi:hypothetical protein
LTFRPRVEALEAREVPATMTWKGYSGVDILFSNKDNWLLDGSPATRIPQAGDHLVFSGHETQTDCVGLVSDPAGPYASIRFEVAVPVYLGGDVVTQVLNLHGGAIGNTANGQDITVTDQFNWTDGSINTWSPFGGPFTGELKLDGAIALIAPLDAGTVYLGSTLNLINGAIATMGAGTISITNAGPEVNIEANSKLVIDAGVGGILALTTLAGASQINLKAGGELAAQAGRWESDAPLKNTGGTFTVDTRAFALFSGAVIGDAGGRSIVQTSGTTRLYCFSDASPTNARLNAQNGMLMSGGTLAVRPTQNGFELGGPATIRLGGLADKTLTISGGQIIYEDNYLGDNHVFAELKITGHVNWTGGTYRPFVSADFESEADLWRVEGSFSIGGTAAVAATAVDGENNSVPPPTGKLWLFLIGGEGITNAAGTPTINPGWSFATDDLNPHVRWFLQGLLVP